MVDINATIMGLPPVNIIDNEITEFDANCAIELANKIYEQVKKEHSDVFDTGILRAYAIFKIVLELQTIKGNQEVFLDTNTKRMKELIKLVESIDSPI
jgi:hypothetical protein